MSLDPLTVAGTYLIADIGATNARFRMIGEFEGPGNLVLRTIDYSTSEELLLAAKNELQIENLSGAMLSVAGPVNKDRGSVVLTNSGHYFLAEELEKTLGCSVWFENDFVALAHGLDHFVDLLQLGGDSTNELVSAVLGPGSGLGMATILREENCLRVLASEGGHADFAPGSHLESEIWSVLAMDSKYVSWESVLSGNGLVRLYEAMCRVWGSKSSNYEAEDITRLGASLDDPICHQTLETFYGILGSVAGNFALTVGAFGGVYLAGSIVPATSDFALKSPLRRRFEEKEALEQLLSTVPIFIIKDSSPGLIGVEQCLEKRLNHQ